MKLEKLIKENPNINNDIYLYLNLGGLGLSGISKIDFPGNFSIENLLHSYGKDLIAPAAFYFLGRHFEFKSRSLILSLGIGTVFYETLQGLVRAQGFDPNDYFCYALSLSLGYLLDKKIQNKNNI